MKTGFIGSGNMGGALAKALVGKSELYMSDAVSEKALSLAKETGGQATDSRAIAEKADYIFLGVKPFKAKEALDEINDALCARQNQPVLVTMLAGVSMESIEDMLSRRLPIIRIMPNIPAASGNGVIMYAANDLVTSEKLDNFVAAMIGAGELIKMEEKLIDAGSAVSGCGPAFAAMFVEALADGGVLCGLSRADALRLAEATVAGTAKHMLLSGMHPAVMKDAVCSPGGTTIQGVRALEDGGFRSAAIDAVVKAYEKTIK